MKKIILLATLILLLVFVLTACGNTVTWLDGDGSLLYEEKVQKDQAIPEKPLPEDNDEWDYTEWKITEENGKTTYTALREAKDRYEWRDADGAVLHKESVKGGSPAPVFELPKDTEKFDYTEWKQSVENAINVYTAFGYSGKTVLWRDVDGTVLYTVFVKDGDSVPERYLPNDTIDWHYTEWKEENGGFVAVRIAKDKVHWLDVDGKELYVDGIIPGEEITLREFPKDSKKWIYKEWVDVTEAGGEKTYIAVADMNPNYFKGNVFQIMTKTLYGEPMSLGSGFVFNQSGWFITNYHVIENAVSADAVFEIENYQTGDSYTSLNISHAYYSSPEKDLFIGKIEDYKKISSYYQDIPIVRDYSVGDKVYTVGYPSASIKMEIHEGNVVDESEKKVNSLYEKLMGGSTYIPSTAYCAPGSSGGILINEKLEVIGLVTGRLEEKKEFVLGAAIRSFNFQNATNNVNTKNAKDFISFFYPENASAIKLFKLGETHENCVGLYKDSSGVYYQYMFTNKYDNGEDALIIDVYNTGLVVATYVYAWKDGAISTSVLTGYYTGKNPSIDDFGFVFVHTTSNGNAYRVTSTNINYSSDINKTLKDCATEPLTNIKVTAEGINHAKEEFNNLYVKLRDFLNLIK